MASSASYFLPPAWLACDRGQALQLEDATSGAVLNVSGALRDHLLAGHPEAAAELRSLAAVEPALRTLADSAALGPLQPLTRAAVLRGTGYRLLFLELTATCNERCLHCYAGASPQRTETLSLEAVRAILTDARALGFTAVQLTGGDPLLSPHCPAAAEAALELGFDTVEVYTNGLALEGALADQLLALPLAWAFSVYSHQPATHDAITRVEGSHGRTVAAIRLALGRGRPVRIGVVLMDANASHAQATLAFLAGLGIPPEAVGVDVQRQVGRGRYTVDVASLPQRTGESHVVQGRHPFEGRAAVTADGTVFPCIFTRAVPLGSVHERRLAEILTDERPVVLSDAANASAERLTTRLSCWECRLRAALLQPSAGEAPG